MGLKWCWFFATLTASLIICTGAGFIEGDWAASMFAGFLIMPFALIVTSPSMVIWALFLEGKSRLRFVTTGSIFSMAMMGWIEFDIIMRGNFEDIIMIAICGVAGGAGAYVWHYFENLEVS